MTLTGDPRRWASEPGLPGVVHVLDPYHGLARGWDTAQESLAMLEEVIQLEGPQTIAAFILESVTGTNGVLVPPDGYMQGVRELCTKHGILMICDEVMAGFGRTGEWFAIDHWKVVPDIITMAKGLTAAYVQLGAVGMRRGVADQFKDKVFYGGLTYNSHTLACAAALAAIQVYEEDKLLENARRMGAVMKSLMADWRAVTPRSAPPGRWPVRSLRAGARQGEEDAARAVQRHVRRDGRARQVLQAGRALHLRPVEHVLHEPAAVHHGGGAPRGVGIIDRGLEITDRAVS
jgi:taurine--2-oxoglutarate transaminase